MVYRSEERKRNKLSEKIKIESTLKSLILQEKDHVEYFKTVKILRKEKFCWFQLSGFSTLKTIPSRMEIPYIMQVIGCFTKSALSSNTKLW